MEQLPAADVRFYLWNRAEPGRKKKKYIEALIFLPLASQRIRWLRLRRKDLLPEAEWVPQAHSLLSFSRRLRLYLCCIIRQHQRNGREIGHHTSGHEGGGRFQVALFQHYSWQQQESRLIRLTHEYMHFMTAFGLRHGSRRKLWGPVFKNSNDVDTDNSKVTARGERDWGEQRMQRGE